MIEKIKNWIDFKKSQKEENKRNYGKRKPFYIQTIFNKKKRKERYKIEGVYKDLVKDYNNLVHERGLYIIELEYYKKELKKIIYDEEIDTNKTEQSELEYTITISVLKEMIEYCVKKINQRGKKLLELKPALKKYSWLNKKKIPPDNYFELYLPEDKNNLEKLSEEEKDKLAYQELYGLFDTNGDLKRKNRRFKLRKMRRRKNKNPKQNKIVKKNKTAEPNKDKRKNKTKIKNYTLPRQVLVSKEQTKMKISRKLLEELKLRQEKIQQKNNYKISELEKKIRKEYYEKLKENTNIQNNEKGLTQERIYLLEDKKRKLEDELIKKAIKDFEYKIKTTKQRQQLRETVIEMLEKKSSKEPKQKEKEETSITEEKSEMNLISNKKENCETEVREIYNKILTIYEIIEEKYQIKEYEQLETNLQSTYEEKLNALKVEYQIESYQKECKKAEEDYKNPQLESFLTAVKQTIKERYEKEYHISQFTKKYIELQKNKEKINNIIERKYHIMEFKQHEKSLKEYATTEYQKIINKYGINKFNKAWNKIKEENQLIDMEDTKKYKK